LNVVLRMGQLISCNLNHDFDDIIKNNKLLLIKLYLIFLLEISVPMHLVDKYIVMI